MPEQRPDPDELLHRLHTAEAAPGKLRIYFGASAGVGKTYAMLLAGQRRHADGVDVLVGIAETHGRAETAALLDGLDVLPRREVPHRGHVLTEFDLDAALERRPQLILVDELAHSNAAGSRHAKRWQDVAELRAAGIDVYSTLNVQHLESLNDVVGGITGIRVHETLPDSFFDAADEVVLVDTPADELLARLAAGKVYLGDQAQRAAGNFFRKGNLMALRELALRRTADRVEADVQAYRSDSRIEPVWKTQASLLCCIGPGAGGEHVVRSAAHLANQLAVGWHAVYVETPALQRLPSGQRERILARVKLAQALGAQTAVLTGQEAPLVVSDYARQHNFSKVVLGPRSPSRLWAGRRFAEQLARHAPEIDRIEIGAGASGSAVPAMPSAPDVPRVERKRYGYAIAAGACALVSIAATPLLPYLDLANIVMLFLLTVVAVALRCGRGPAVLAAFLSVAAFDFFFVPPRFTFAVSDVQYLIVFAVMLVVALIVGQMTAGITYQARVASRRESRARALYEFARELSGLLLPQQAVAVAQSTLAREFQSEVSVLTLGANDRLQAASASATSAVLGVDMASAQWALEHDQPAGRGTDTLAGSPWLYLPLKASMRTRGVLALRPRDGGWLMVPEQRQHLDTFATLLAIALERVHYVDVAQKATVQIESERLRNSLLAALSHDLRTPLAVLYGLADTLALRPLLPAPERELAQSLRDGARRMNTLVSNLLDMARLQSGTLHLKLQWQSLEEVVGTALEGLKPVLDHHRLTVCLPRGLPLVQFDAVLIERVLVNLLENAAKYTPAGSAIELSAQVRDAELVVCVTDNGPGLPPGQEEAVFEKFVRGRRESVTPGVGLGLSICRAIVQAHQGRVWAEHADGRGARVCFALALGVPPVLPDTADDEMAAPPDAAHET